MEDLVEKKSYMGYERSKADRCLNWEYNDTKGLPVWLSCVDGYCVLGHKGVVLTNKEYLKQLSE